ncbi:MAG: efflux RND transporter periplasmic adaptor subunit, partial [Clostridiales bacterium]
KVGDYVRAGQVLATLENSEYQAQLNQANASYSMASSAYADAAKNLERMRSLYSEGAVALNQVEQAELNLESKSLEGARAALTMAQSNYDNTIFKSPINGQVAEVNLVQGVMAGAQQSSIRIIDAKKVKMAATVSEAFINKVEKNQVVDVLVASTGNVPYKGRITTVAPAANSQTLTFPIEITIDNSQGILKPGMFAEINLPIDTAMAAITVPKEALINNMGNYRVFVIAAGKSYLKDVIIGLQSDTDVEIKSGLSADQRVVIKGGDIILDLGNNYYI